MKVTVYDKEIYPTIALEILDGDYGNGNERKQKLTDVFGDEFYQYLQQRANMIIEKKAKLMEYAKIEDEFCDHFQLNEILDIYNSLLENIELGDVLNFLTKVGYLCEVPFINYLKMRKELKPLRMKVKLGWWLSFYD